MLVIVGAAGAVAAAGVVFKGASAAPITIAVVPVTGVTVLIGPVGQEPSASVLYPTIAFAASDRCSIRLTPFALLLGIEVLHAPALVEYPVITLPIVTPIDSTGTMDKGRPVPETLS
jgi:hypothetical protein